MIELTDSAADGSSGTESVEPWKLYICIACGLIYNEEEGDPDSGLVPGTRFSDIPDDWECPVCGVTKKDFIPYVRRERTAVAASIVTNKAKGVVIVGAGMAGWAMAEAIRLTDNHIPITLITACSGDRYNKPELSVSFARTSSSESLVRAHAIDEAQRLDINLVNHTFVVSVSSGRQHVRTTRGTFEYTQLVIAQGSRTTLPEYLPENLCWRINLLSDWQALLPKLQSEPKRLAIVGAGMVGCELAEDLCKMGHSVSLLSRNEQPLKGVLPEPAARRLLAAQVALGIDFLNSKHIAQVRKEDDGSKTILFSSGDALQVDEIIAATGVATDKRIADRAQIEFDNGIVVDPKTLETSRNNIYAVGDCVSFAGESHRYIGLIEQQISVVAEAVVHGTVSSQYENQLPPVVLKTKSCPIEINGMPDETSDWTVVQETESYLFMKQASSGGNHATISIGRPS